MGTCLAPPRAPPSWPASRADQGKGCGGPGSFPGPPGLPCTLRTVLLPARGYPLPEKRRSWPRETAEGGKGAWELCGYIRPQAWRNVTRPAREEASGLRLNLSQGRAAPPNWMGHRLQAPGKRLHMCVPSSPRAREAVTDKGGWEDPRKQCAPGTVHARPRNGERTCEQASPGCIQSPRVCLLVLPLCMWLHFYTGPWGPLLVCPCPTPPGRPGSIHRDSEQEPLTLNWFEGRGEPAQLAGLGDAVWSQAWSHCPSGTSRGREHPQNPPSSSSRIPDRKSVV